MQQTIHKGALAPYALEVVFTSDDPGFDLSAATSASFKVRREVQREDVDTESWAAVLSAAVKNGNHSEVTVRHVYVEGDLPKVGVLQLYAEIELPAGATQSHPFKLLVGSKFSE